MNGCKMVQVSKRRKPLHQLFSELDNTVVSAFCDSFNGVEWLPDFKDVKDEYCGIDLQLTATSKNKQDTYDVEIKSRVTLDNFALATDCFFEWDKWFKLCQWDNNKKLYIVIYPNCNKIAVWTVNSRLFRTSEKEFVEVKRNTCRGNYTKQKLMYRFKMKDAKVFDFNLTEYKSKYNALYKEITKATKK